MENWTQGQLRIYAITLEYIGQWLPIIALSLPCLWAVIYHNWYYDWRKRKERERWERLARFFAKNSEKYPDAAASFGMARFFASEGGRDLMYKIKQQEFESMTQERREL